MSCYIAIKRSMELMWCKLAQKTSTFPKLYVKTKPALYFLYFDFDWKLFPASSESFHISESMVKGEQVRVGGSWLLSHQGQLQPPSPIPGVMRARD